MYNKPQPLLLVIAGGLLTIAACGSFGSEPPEGARNAGGSEAGAEDGGREGGVLDGGAAGPSDGAIAPIVGAQCGSVECAIGKGCCLTSLSPVCTTRSACQGFFVTCAAPGDCGSQGACCFDGVRTSCAGSCGGGERSLCRSGSGCAQGVCAPVACDADTAPPSSPFLLCTGTAATSVTREGLTCRLP